MSLHDDDRLFLIRETLRARKLSALLITDSTDAEYLSGFHSSNATLLIDKRSACLFSDSRYEEAGARFAATHPEWRFVKVAEGGFAGLKKHLAKKTRVGLAFGGLTHAQFLRLAELHPQLQFEDISADLAALQSLKQASEIRAMKKAAAIADAALAQLAFLIDAGWTEERAAAELDTFCRSKGSSGPSFPTIVLFGEHSALPHGVPGTRRLKSGDFILVDFGCIVDGFCSDMTRTFIYGKASARHIALYETVLAAHDAALALVREGALCGSIDAAARDIITAASLGEYFGHATGHGVGRRIHEFPRLKAGDTTPLLAGMVVTVEPGIYIPGFGGVRIEDMVAVKSRGAALLSSFPRECAIL